MIREIRLTSSDKYPYKLGSEVSFKDTGNSHKYRTYGWSRTEFWGTSSIGNESGVFLNLGNKFPEELVLEFKASGYVFDNWPQQQVDIVINGIVVKTLTIKDKNKNTHRVNFSANPESNGTLDIAFRYRNAVKTSEIGVSNDTRLQAIAVIDLKVFPFMPTTDSRR